MAAQLWNKALEQRPSEYLALALRDNVRLAMQSGLATVKKKGLWAYSFIGCLQQLGLTWADEGGAPKKIDIRALVVAATSNWESKEGKNVASAEGQPWMEDGLAVRAAPESFSRGFMGLVHRQWFRADKWVRKESFAFHLSQPTHVKIVAQFRLGMHWLEVQQGRWKKGSNGLGVPRSQRTCPLCKQGVEDELHLWECPAYEQHRDRYKDLCEKPPEGWTDGAFRERMNRGSQQNWTDLAGFLGCCKDTRMKALEQLNSAGATVVVGTQRVGPPH
jgi:hypothetical protein